LIILPNEAIFLTDGRYEIQSRNEVRSARIVMGGYDLFAYAAENDLLSGCRRAVFQSDEFTVASFESLGNQFGEVEWIGATELLVKEVASKSNEEVDRIRAAQRLTESVFDAMLNWVRPGLSEKEIAAEITYLHLKLGARKMSFEPVVASGTNSALPHAEPTDRVVQKGDVLLLDFGCFLDGYASDMTRTVAVGEPCTEVRDVYEVVVEAQQTALASARSGMLAPDLDAAARTVIEDAGFGSNFSHSLGHGIGLRIHEWPRVSYSVEYALPDRAVITIEPGIYLPDRFGIRIEDMVQLHPEGAENLTAAPKELIVL
jgi:Xaa-Pro aminopeptidase